jgi:DNA polymerase I-like protein with 3'-5' exonuclease and polymerase domains
MIYLVTNQQAMFSPSGYSMATVEESLEYLKNLDVIGFDTETRGMDPYTKDLLSMQLGDQDKQFVIDCSTVNPRLYKEILESKELIMHNAKFDLRFLYYYEIVPTKIYDSFLIERILTTGIDTARRSLDAVVYKYCKIELDKSIRGHIHREGLSTRVIKYAADDVKYLHQVKRKQEVSLRENNLTRTASLDNEFVKVLAYIEYCGMYMNPKDWQNKCLDDLKDLNAVKEILDKFILDNSEKYRNYIDNQLSLFEEGTKCKLNWASSKQVIPFMQSLGVDTLTKDKETGLMKHSVDKKVLGPQKKKHPIISTYIEYTEHQKVVSTYGDNWFDYINPVTGRIHSNYTQIMNTGRLSSGQKGKPKQGIPQMPNMQNIPSDNRTRSCFQAEAGNMLIVSDYSGQEQIVLANKSLDKDLIRFYKEGLGDMHSFIASKIFPELSNLSLDEIKDNHKNKRQIAKGAGFAINYGGTGITIAQNLSLSLEEGEEVYKAYFKAFPGLADYFKQEKQRALKLGYIEFNAVSNRKCFIPFFEDFQKLHKELYETEGFWESYKLEKSQDSAIFKSYFKPKVREYFIKKGDIERMSLNYPIQGTSADITKLAGVYFFRYLLENNLVFKVKLPNVVHDEWIVEAPENMAESISKVLQECMEKAGDVFCKTIKLKADPCITLNWKH